MARTSLQINFETPPDAIFSICDAAGMEEKGANEVYYSIDALRVWHDRFTRLYGTLMDCVHHSNPDDPPDLALNFANRPVEVEHTRLEPSLYGWTNALRREECADHCIRLPSISFQPRSREDLLSSMLSRGGEWPDLPTELGEWYRYCMWEIREKIRNGPEGILVIQETSLIVDQLMCIAETVHAELSPRPSQIQGWTILLHSRRNSIQFDSYLIAAHEDLQHRMG